MTSGSFETLGNTHPTTRHRITKERNVQLHHSGKVKSGNFNLSNLGGCF